MSETLEYIDTYFNGKLSATEKAAFESRCASDPVFAADVAFYISARAQLKDDLYAEKKKAFHELYIELSSAAKGKGQKSILIKMLPYAATAAAACLLIILGWQLFFKEADPKNQFPKQLADKYIVDNVQQLGVSMGSDKDSLERGIEAFNNKNYKEAESIFQSLSAQEKTRAEAIKDLGLLYLVTGKYEQAISQFDILSNIPGLYINPGLFYKALTLMERSSTGDRQMAKKLLEQVIAKDLPGKKEAELWMQKL